MEHTRDYTHTLRMPVTAFPVRALASTSFASELSGGEARGRDLTRMMELSAKQSTRLQAEETYRALRNCLRWLLGCLHHDANVEASATPTLEEFMSQKLEGTLATFGQLMTVGATGKAMGVLQAFVVEDLLECYFDMRKDALYCETGSNPKRLACLTFMRSCFEALVAMSAGVAPNLAREAWACGPKSNCPLPEMPTDAGPTDVTDLEKNWAKVLEIRRTALAAFGVLRANKAFNSSLDASATIYVSDPDLAAQLEASNCEWEEVLAMSSGEVVFVDPKDRPDVSFEFARAEGGRCSRSRKVRKDVGKDLEYPTLSLRDAAAVREYWASQR